MKIAWEDIAQSQAVAAQILQNSFKNNRLAHAYLLEGMRGTQKRATGLLMAKTFLCRDLTDGYEPCNSCSQCLRVESGNHPDLHILEPDGISIKKDQIGGLQEEFSKSGLESSKKVYLIVDADKMTTSAANSLLKFLEEPHRETLAILITEQVKRILPTILSRCQIIKFNQLAPSLFIEQLIENGVSENQAFLLANITNNLTEALELNSDEGFLQSQEKVLKLYNILKSPPLEALLFLKTDWMDHFKEKHQLEQALDLLLIVYKDVLNTQLEREDQVVFKEWQNTFRQDALRTRQLRLAEQLSIVLEAKKKLQTNINNQLLMERLVLKLQGGTLLV